MEGNIERLEALFKEKFSSTPNNIIRCPGRVNLIGEHIDYCGYSVLPMAIEQSIVLGFAKTTTTSLTIENSNDEYDSFSTDINDFSIDGNIPSWYKYVLCGIQGIKDQFIGQLDYGMNILIDGNIPPSAGLSSSSALVCSAAMAMAEVCDMKMDKNKLADICAKAERYIGTQGGGMDQAACLLSIKGMAIKINFNPLSTELTRLPNEGIFVVANSLVKANKAATSHYNTRVMECRLAARLIAKHAGRTDDEINNGNLSKLKNLHLILNKTFVEMIQLVKEVLHEKPYDQEEICEVLNISKDDLHKDILSENTLTVNEFFLQQRALHVFSEAERVDSFRLLCGSLQKENSSADNQKILVDLGKVMNASHYSTQNLYCCSHPKLDRLVEIAQKLAYGARLTGAGWGGCMVALVAKEKVDDFKNLLLQEYYRKEESSTGLKEEYFMFVTQPENGAALIY